jgi:hypothetical protein
MSKKIGVCPYYYSIITIINLYYPIICPLLSVNKCGGQIKVYEKSFDEQVVEDITDKEEGDLLSATLWLL